MTKLRLDLNKPEFQEQLFAVKKQEHNEVRGTLKNLYQMAWKQAFVDRGPTMGAHALKAGTPRRVALHAPHVPRISCRSLSAVDWMVFLALHPDRESAYD